MANLEDLRNIYSEYKPNSMFVLYTNSEGQVYMDKYPILTNGSDNMIGEPRPVIMQDMEELKKLQFETAKSKRKIVDEKDLIQDIVLPSNVLFIKQRPLSLAWFIKGKRRKLLFDDQAGVKGSEFTCPGIVFHLDSRIGINCNINIYAVKTDRIKFDTTLFSPPFMNCNTSGGICMPYDFSRLKKIQKLSNIMTFVEDRFFNSYFSHIGDQTLKGENSLLKLWNNMAKKDAVFPLDVLKSTGKTIKKLYEKKNSLRF